MRRTGNPSNPRECRVLRRRPFAACAWACGSRRHSDQAARTFDQVLELAAANGDARASHGDGGWSRAPAALEEWRQPLRRITRRSRCRL